MYPRSLWCYQVDPVRVSVVQDEAVVVVGQDDQLELVPKRGPVAEAGVAEVGRGQLATAVEGGNL